MVTQITVTAVCNEITNMMILDGADNNVQRDVISTINMLLLESQYVNYVKQQFDTIQNSSADNSASYVTNLLLLAINVNTTLQSMVPLKKRISKSI